MMPSDFQLKTDNLEVYNNKILIAGNHMTVGKNLINLHVVVKPDKGAFKTSQEHVKVQKLPLYKIKLAETHDTAKTTLTV